MTFGRPRTITDAVAYLRDAPATILAGGTDLFATSVSADASQDFLDISEIAELRGISRKRGEVRIGAATTWSDIAAASLPPSCAALSEAARQVGGAQVQNAGTIAGNLCNASPAADGVPGLMVLDAMVELASPRGLRRLALVDFLTGPRRTARLPDELVTAILFQEPHPESRSNFEKLGSRAYLVISIVMAAALVRLDEQGRIAEARVAVGACSPVARRLNGLESEIAGQRPEAVRVEDRHLAPLAPISDPRASAAYRADAVRELVRRAIRRAGSGYG